jgi:hypothetical protein
LPSTYDYPECNDQGSRSYKRSRHIDEPYRLGKKVSVHDRLGGRTMLRDPVGRRIPAHDRLEQMADDREQDDQPMRRDPERKPDSDRTNQPQWCPGGLSRSQKRRVQRLCQLEIIEEEQERTLGKKGVKSQVWRVIARADGEQDDGSSAGNDSTPIQAVGSSESS